MSCDVQSTKTVKERKRKRRTAADAVLEEVQTVCVHIHQHTKRVGVRDPLAPLDSRHINVRTIHQRKKAYRMVTGKGAKRRCACFVPWAEHLGVAEHLVVVRE